MSEDVSRQCDNRIRRSRKTVRCGGPVDEPTRFAIDDTSWSIDLCDECKLRFRDAVADFIQIATPEYKVLHAGIRKAMRLRNGETFTVADVRVWAQENNIDVSVTGRVKQDVIDQYKVVMEAGS